jgi:hypothetical protein
MKYLILVLLAVFGCENIPVQVDPVPSPTPSAVASVIPKPSETPNSSVPVLSWDNSVRKDWSKYVYELLKGELFDVYNSAQDNERLCPKFKSLTKEQKAHVWSEFWVQVAYHESGWNPKSKYFEKTMGYYSEGLLQLSYVDKQWAPYCKFPAKQDAAESILDPYINLDCGLKIMAKQIEKKGKIIVSSGVYWAVIKDGGSYQKIDAITGKTKALAFCIK